MSRLARSFGLLLAGALLGAPSSLAAQSSSAANETSTYRLTAPALARYTRALHDYAALVRRDPSVVGRDKSPSPAAAKLFRAAGMTEEEFGRFTQSMFEAMLAREGIRMGMKPAEIPAITRANMAFVAARDAQFAALGADIRALQDASERAEKQASAASSESGSDEDQQDPPTR